MANPTERADDEPVPVDERRSSSLQAVLGWLVLSGLAGMVLAFCVVTFGQLTVAGWVGEQTEAWYLVVLAAGGVALASAIALILLRGRSGR